MFRTEKATIVYSAISAFAAVAAIIVDILILFTDGRTLEVRLTAAVVILALLGALIYLLTGYQKDSAVFHRIFLVLYAVSTVFQNVSITYVGESVFSRINVALYTVIFGNVLVLLLAKDFGKTKTFAVCGVNLLCSAVLLASRIAVLNPELTAFEVLRDIEMILLVASEVVISLIAFVVSAAKYADKEARGRSVN